MRTRVAKWARYRAKIKNTPDQKFPRRAADVPQTESDAAVFSQTLAHGAALTYEALPSLKRKKPLLYATHVRRARVWLIVKIVALALAIAGFVALWFLWVVK